REPHDTIFPTSVLSSRSPTSCLRRRACVSGTPTRSFVHWEGRFTGQEKPNRLIAFPQTSEPHWMYGS
ncbi:unnamed protein product, partial [Musa acuminata var. zebrina]